MNKFIRSIALLGVLLSIIATVPPAGSAASLSYHVRLPMVFGAISIPNRLGVTIKSYSSNIVMSRFNELQPGWARAGDVLWPEVEPVAGGGYHWESLQALEANIRRIKAAGAEPIVIIQRTPDWAQKLPGRLCSPPAPDKVEAFSRFVSAVVQRYSSGPLKVNYWQFWNEPDFTPEQIPDILGSGCWGTSTPPYYGGDYYGEVLKQFAGAVKSKNREARVFAGAVAHLWPDDTQTLGFLRGMLVVGGGYVTDAITYSGYGMWGSSDRMMLKAARIRGVLAEQRQGFPKLVASEIGLTCPTSDTCPPDHLQIQADYAARIYPAVIAIDLYGALWFSLAESNPMMTLNGHLIDEIGGVAIPRPSFYALRNSARIMQGAQYIGPAITNPPIDQMKQVQSLAFTTPRGTLYVLWLTERGGYTAPYQFPLAPGTRVTCTQHLEYPTPIVSDCSEFGSPGGLAINITASPLYIEVLR